MPGITKSRAYTSIHPYFHAKYLEPVNGAAVDEGGEHAEAVTEGIPNGAHGKDHVKVLLHPLNEEVVHGQRSGLNLTALM